MSQTLTAPLSDREAEALLWGLCYMTDYADEVEPGVMTDPVGILKTAGYTTERIRDTSEKLHQFCYDRAVSGPLSTLESEILRVSIEHSSWSEAYRRNTEHICEADRQFVFRRLATILDKFGVTINRLPE